MRKLFLLVIALLGVLVVGCENLFPTEQSPNATPIFETDSEGSYTVKAEGEEIDILVTTNIDYSVVIPTDAKEWLSAVCTRSDAREEILAFVVAPNDSFEERSTRAELVDANGKVLESISFIQEGQSKVFRVDGNGNYVVTGLGGNVEVVVTTNLEYSVVIQKGAQSWLSVADTRADVRRETLTFIVAENEAYETRTATVELVGDDNQVLQKISIIQEEKVDTFIMTGENNYLVVAEGGEVNVVLITNLDYSVVIEKDAQVWLSVADTRALRIDELTFVVAPNTSYEERTTTVELVDDKNKVLQEISFTQNAAAQSGSVCPNNEIWYTNGSTTEPTYPNNPDAFGVNIVSNTYDAENERWVIEFDGNVTTIGDCAFVGCSSLTSVTIPDSVTTIGELVFYLCSSLTSVTIPDSVTTIRNAAFTGCSSLREFNGKYASEDGRCLIIDGTLNSFAPAGLSEYTIPDSVTTIGFAAFFDCSSLTSVTIPDSVTTIGNEAFAWCSSLTSITIPDSVTTIGALAFVWCESLTSVYCKAVVPPSVTLILSYEEESEVWYWYAFDSNASGRKIYVPTESVAAYKSASYWNSYADAIVGYDFDSNNTETDMAKPANNEIWYTSSDGNIVEPCSAEYVEYEDIYSAFGANIVSNAYDAEKECWVIKFDGDVTTIGESAFYDCRSLTSVTIPDSVTAIGDFAFSYCLGLAAFKGKFADDNGRILVINNSLVAFAPAAGDFKTYDIPEGITGLGNGAFYGCFSLNSVTIPKTVTTIGYATFGYCNYLKSVYCKATTPPIAIFDYQMMVWYAFRGGDMNPYIYVPIQSVEAYKSAEGWDNYADAIVGYNF